MIAMAQLSRTAKALWQLWDNSQKQLSDYDSYGKILKIIKT